MNARTTSGDTSGTQELNCSVDFDCIWKAVSSGGSSGDILTTRFDARRKENFREQTLPACNISCARRTVPKNRKRHDVLIVASTYARDTRHRRKY
ncbi:hypothetical protein ALC60_08575 [Trachymyrmex zeteki]|uniref:Uncharacterized protein n=1 Tax=Mycetomoellerius zeteki TaxID=64791 RepID=A0A151WWJ1_9HYME|nr:hypothetical protein ALC60_08575 [Trachymyrmex zeteki]